MKHSHSRGFNVHNTSITALHTAVFLDEDIPLAPGNVYKSRDVKPYSITMFPSFPERNVSLKPKVLFDNICSCLFRDARSNASAYSFIPTLKQCGSNYNNAPERSPL